MCKNANCFLSYPFWKPKSETQWILFIYSFFVLVTSISIDVIQNACSESLRKNFESIFDEKAFGFLLLCQSLSSENIDSVLLAQTCRLLIQSRHDGLTESNGFRAYSVPLLYFGSLDGLSASSEKVLAPPVEIPMYHVRCECSTSIDKNLFDFRQYILWTLASVFPRKSPTG